MAKAKEKLFFLPQLSVDFAAAESAAPHEKQRTHMAPVHRH